MWIVYALGSALFYALATMVAKISVSKVVRDQRGIVVVHAAAAFVWVGAIWLANGRPELAGIKDTVLALLTGLLVCIAAVFYFKAFNMEDISMVTLLSQITVLFTLVAGFFILGDKVRLWQLVAALIILCGVVIATWSRKGFHLRSTEVIPVILVATILTTAVFVLAKSVVGHSNTIAFTFYQIIGYLLAASVFTVFHGKTRRGFMKNMHPFHGKMLLVILMSELLYTFANLSQFQGFKYANAGLVISVGASEVFLSILLGYVLTTFVPHIITEKIDKKTIGRKVIAGVLIVTGIVILNFVG